MRSITWLLIACLSLLAVATTVSRADHRLLRDVRNMGAIITSADATGLATSRQDTIYLMGGPGDWTGRFENSDGSPSWHGWTHIDETAPGTSHWHASDYWGHSVGADPYPGNHAAYCGDETIPSCSDLDPEGGYGNNWTDWLDWVHPAPDPGQPTLVAMDYYINHDVEPGYDFVRLMVNREIGFESVRTYTGQHVNQHEQFEFTVDVEDYTGDDGDQIRLRFVSTSDFSVSDEDCLRPTHGTCQIDDVTVTLDGDATTFDDFEGGLGSWVPTLAPGVGDFAALRFQLGDLDPCRDNYSWQVSFVDDGEVVPGTDGTSCISWCYGPDGWIVNNTGGLAGPDFHINNQVISPPLEWPAGGCGGAILEFDVYVHEELGDLGTWPGVFVQWNVRSTDTGNPADLEVAEWQSHVADDFLGYGSPLYLRPSLVVSDLMVPGRTHVQISLGCIELGYLWGFDGVDGTPAPYFDNVQFKIFAQEGPGLSTPEWLLAQDTFPERGSIDYNHLQVNWCRFDMAMDIVGDDDPAIRHGDSLVVEIVPLRVDAELTTAPRLNYRLKTNPLFNDVRGSELGTPDADGFITGFMEGHEIFVNGIPRVGRYAFDMPDTGQFYPGDVLHYYIWAEDAIGGVFEPQVATLPSDIAEFADFSRPTAYEQRFTVQFLPTMFSPLPGDQPPVLFWQDTGSGTAEWHGALLNNGFIQGEHFDSYFTNGSDFSVSNGLGALATASLLQHYDILLYTCGPNLILTITPPYPLGDKGDDTGVLAAWFEQGNKSAFFTGNNLAHDLYVYAPSFLHTWLSIDFELDAVRSYIDNQVAPVVQATGEPNPVFGLNVGQWVAYGGCPHSSDFDGVSLRGDAQWAAEFTNPQGYPGSYEYPAATYHADVARGNQVVYLPYDFQYIGTPVVGGRNNPAPISARARVLRDVMLTFGMQPGPAVDVPGAQLPFAATAHPNPFNPAITIEFTLPRPGEVSLKIYSVRGELIRILIDGERHDAGRQSTIWAGDDESGGRAASGVYFYEVRSGGERKVGKIALVK